MTTIRTIRISCDCSCCHVGDHGCHVHYPARPIESTARALRAEAASIGWETVRHTKGRDVCPPCRIREIQAAAGGAP